MVRCFELINLTDNMMFIPVAEIRWQWWTSFLNVEYMVFINVSDEICQFLLGVC